MQTRLAMTYDAFLADATHLDRLRPHTLRADRYELAAAANDARLARQENGTRWVGSNGVSRVRMTRRHDAEELGVGKLTRPVLKAGGERQLSPPSQPYEKQDSAAVYREGVDVAAM